MNKADGFEQRAQLGSSYWDDPRWKEVKKLRDEGKILDSNHLVFVIRQSWGVE